MQDAKPDLTPEIVSRFPLIDPAGARLLRYLEEHPHAPNFTHPGVDRLTPGGLRGAADFAAQREAEPPRWRPDRPPDWLMEFVARLYHDVPLYRRRGAPPQRFADVPTTCRADLGREPWSFVPDGQSLDGLVVYNTSGTTGHPLSILTHADTLALYLPLLRSALALHGVRLEGGPGRVAVVVAAFQTRTYTYAAVSAVLEQAGVVKVNLDPAGWRDPADRARFLDACAPEVITGDPLAFAELARLPITARPKALVSTAMTLAPGLKQALEARFGCPVVDVYSLNESGPVAVGAGPGFQLLQPRLYVEILDGAGRPCPLDERGEVTLTGGFNPCLPLLRYRTNDFARLTFDDDRPALADLDGRAPVVFRAADGRPVNNIDVSLALRDLPLPQYQLHQAADGALRLRLTPSPVAEAVLRDRLLGVFGPGHPLVIEVVADLDAPGGKRLQFTRDPFPDKG